MERLRLPSERVQASGGRFVGRGRRVLGWFACSLRDEAGAAAMAAGTHLLLQSCRRL